MSEQAAKKITNVWISAGDNHLQLADILFDDTILEVRAKLNTPVNWEDIADKEKLTRFRQQFRSGPEPEGKEQSGDFMFLMPGAIDSHVHFNTPGFEEREDFEHGSAAAAAGGVTTVIDMPCTSLPPVTSLQNMQHKLEVLEGRSYVDYALWGGIRGNDFNAMLNMQEQVKSLAENGVAGFKAYLVSGMDTFRDLKCPQLFQVAEWLQPFGKPLAVHAEDREAVLSRQILLQELGRTDWLAYCKSRDDRAEAGAIANLVAISRRTKCPVHVVHLSSALGLEMVRHAREDGVAITAETCPHYLFFTQEDFENPEISAFLKTAPPVKLAADREALWQGLANGWLSFVTTDHAGCDPRKEKTSDNFWEIYGGIPGVEHRVPFLFSEGFLKKRLTLQKTVELLSTNVAQYFGLSQKKGILRRGGDADFALINLWEPFTVTAAGMHSKGKYTPFEGIQFAARVEAAWLRGKLISGRNVQPEEKPGYGQWISC